jgi:hypothetical protein
MIPLAVLGVVAIAGAVAYTMSHRAAPVAPAAAVATAQPRLPAPAVAAPSSIAAVSSQSAAVVATVALPEPAKHEQAIGDRFSDDHGPELVVARLPAHGRAGLAVMSAAVDTKLYAEFAKAKGRKGLHCEAGPAPAQGCLDLGMAQDVARWLSSETGHHYRVPTRTELGASVGHVAKASAYAWTDTCHEVRIAQQRNVAQRSWSRLRRLVGKPKPVPYETRCEGHFGVKLDAQGHATEIQTQATAKTVAVLVREL